MVFAVRVDRDKKTNEIKRVKLVDTDDFSVNIVSSSMLKKILTEMPNCIFNIYLDDYNKIRVSDMTIHRNSKAFNVINTPLYKIQQFCIITSYSGGVISWLADDSSFTDNYGLNYATGSTIDRLMDSLGIKSLNDLKLFNGYINENKLFIYTNSNERAKYKLCGLLVTEKNINDTAFDNTWEVEYINRHNISYLEAIKGKGEFKLPEGIEHLEEFGGGVNYLTLPDSLKSLGEGCFSEVEDLIEITLNEGLREIPVNCFENSLIEVVKINGRLDRVGDLAFYECCKFRSIGLCDADEIGDRAFYHTNLRRVALYNTTKIGVESFAYNYKLENVKLGDKLRVIGGGAFRGCDKLETIYIPDSCLKIGKLAFAETKLRTISLSRKTIIGKDALPKKCSVIYRD